MFVDIIKVLCIL